MKRAIIAGVATLLAVSQAFAADKPKPGPTGLDTKEATIPFLDQKSSILDWKANGTTGLWIEDALKQWYYAETFAPCPGLDFAVAIGFRNKILNRLDRDSEIIVPDSHMAVPVQEPEEERSAAGAQASRQEGQGCSRCPRCGRRHQVTLEGECAARVPLPLPGCVSCVAMSTSISVELSLYPLSRITNRRSAISSRV